MSSSRRADAAKGILRAAMTALAASACTFQDLDQWATRDDSAYCGAIVTLPEVYTPPENDGFQPNLEIAMTFDSDLELAPGTLTSNDTNGPCRPSATFDKAPLRLIKQLQHDPLSTFTFGIGRTHNFMAWVTSTCRGSMLATVSLMSDGTAQLRLIKDISPDPDADATDPRAGFALFPMARKSEGCGF